MLIDVVPTIVEYQCIIMSTFLKKIMHNRAFELPDLPYKENGFGFKQF